MPWLFCGGPLVSSGLVYRTGRGDGVSYRALDPEQLKASAAQSEEGLLNLVRITVQQRGPLDLTELELITALPIERLTDALQELTRSGLIAHDVGTDKTLYSSAGCVLPLNDPKGWEAAVFDHYQAMVGALCAKLSAQTRGAQLDDVIGGSTFGFEVWPGHPHYDEVRGLLKHFRQQCMELRERMSQYNQQAEAPPQRQRVITYFGQNVLDDNWEGHEPNDETCK